VEEAVLVLDVGKSRTKLRLVSRTGDIVASRERPNRRLAYHGRLTLDADGIAGWLLSQLSVLAGLAKISAIIPVGHGAAAALMSGETHITPVLDYESEPPNSISASYDRVRGPFEETLSPRLPGGLNLGAQLFWQDRLNLATQRRRSRILLWPQYWTWFLSGEMVSEVTSLGCHTDLWRPREREYSRLAVSQGWHERLPGLAPARTVVGPVRRGIAGEHGLPADCKVLCGLHDSNSALHALRILAPDSGFSVVSTGTWFVVMQAQTPLLSTLNPAFDVLANVDVDGNPVATARFMGGRDYESMLGTDLGVRAGKQQAITLIENGALQRLRYHHSVGKFELPTVEQANANEKSTLASLYLALNTDAALDHIKASGPILVEGRFASDATFTAALAALRSTPVYACASIESVAVGAARLFWDDLVPALLPIQIEPLSARPRTVRDF